MKVEIYTKADCSLCEEAKAVVDKVRRRISFECEEIDITTSDELYQRYRYDIPVIRVDGKFAFRHRVTEVELEERLRTP
jgi:glutaredoxin